MSFKKEYGVSERERATVFHKCDVLVGGDGVIALPLRNDLLVGTVNATVWLLL